MRLFIAIQFNKQILSSLTDLQDEMSAMGVTGNYTRPENLHLTLAFIGDYGDPDAVLDAIAGTDFRPFPIRLDGVGTFGEIFWSGIEENPALMAYTKRLRRALAGEGIPFDKKRFSPHITLIRKYSYRGVKGIPVAEAPQGEMMVERISLIESRRGKNGMIYTEIGCV